MRTEIIPAPTREAPTSVAIAPSSIAMPTIATISGRAVAPNSARQSARRAAELAQPQDRRDPADHEQEREEERREGEAPGAQQAVEVEVHARRDEVDRDQEAEADALEPHPDGLGVGRVERQPHDEPGGERAQDEVEADVVREQRQRRDHEDGEANRHLPGRLDGLLDDAYDRGRAGAQCRHRGERDEGEEPDEEHDLLDRAAASGEEHRDDDDRPELARDAGPEHCDAERRREDPRVAQDRDERPERRRRERDAENPPLGVEAELLQDDAHRQADGGREHPALRPAQDGCPGHLLLDDLEADEEEEEREPEGREVLEVRVDVRDVEHLRADDHAEHDLDHDRGQHDAPGDPRQQRAQARREKDERHRAQVRRDGLGGHC